MNREIKFRGKRVDGLGWAFGDLLTDYIHHEGWTIVHGGCVYFEVDPETVGQYTGLEDVNGKKIFIGDIVKWGHLEHSRENPIRIALVIQRPGQIIFRCTSLKVKPWRDFPFGNFMYQNTERALEIIGNIHDNPELLEVQKNERT